MFDEGVPLREFLSQFGLIARVNNWGETAKVVTLAASLRGKARAVLDEVTDSENLRYSELLARLELRFVEGHLAQLSFTLFMNRKGSGRIYSLWGRTLSVLLASPICPYGLPWKRLKW